MFHYFHCKTKTMLFSPFVQSQTVLHFDFLHILLSFRGETPVCKYAVFLCPSITFSIDTPL